MASSSSTKPNPDNGTIVIVTQHEFNQFHKIDRILFTRLVVSLGRDPGEAMKVMARFGEIIEGIYMQEVNLMEQPLYARLVVRSNAINVIDVFLKGTRKVKFCINRKHVWARKYVPKSPSPSPSPSPGRLAFM
ncbi:uncharacterized protein G2W53_032581 [Senna tora]|uniref:Uncharacterized protein n=1 Tax=Senna tora TaxID=362788 RepID=A0A834SZ71_9FABA|nr:uncharacterized protein G2W53_032581 [Senna tora]